MLQVSQYLEKLKKLGIDGFAIEVKNKAEAKEAISKCRTFQSELSQMKKSISMNIKEIRSEYSHKIANASSGFGTVLTLFGKKGAGRSLNASAKRDMTDERNKAIEPYEHLRLYIDSLSSSLEKAKAQLQTHASMIDADKPKPYLARDGKYCSECGNSLQSKHRFCSNCGTKRE